MVDEAAFGQVVGDADGVDHGRRRRRAVADDADAVDPEQPRPTGVLRVEFGGDRQQVREQHLGGAAELTGASGGYVKLLSRSGRAIARGGGISPITTR